MVLPNYLFLYFVFFLVVILSVLTTVFKSEGPCLIADFSCVRTVLNLFCIVVFFNANTL